MFRRLLSLGTGGYVGLLLGGPIGAGIGLFAGNKLVPCPRKAALAYVREQWPDATDVKITGTKDVSGGTLVYVTSAEGKLAVKVATSGKVLSAEMA